jgi:hypothetical protein
MEAIVKDDLKKEEKKNIATASERPPNRFRLHYCPFWYPFYCRLQFMESGPGSIGTMTWTRGEATLATISAGVKREGEDVALRFQYTHGSGENAQALDYPVRLVKMVPHFGGVRWFFLCPLMVNGEPCLRRVSKLYLPPGGLYFGCRECYGLTYTSSQESHKFDGLYKMLAANVGRGLTSQDVKRALKPLKVTP